MKNAILTLCTFACTEVFTFWQRIFRREREMPEAKPKKQRRENHKNGRERPHFLGFQPPKKFLGSLPPCGTSFRCR